MAPNKKKVNTHSDLFMQSNDEIDLSHGLLAGYVSQTVWYHHHLHMHCTFYYNSVILESGNYRVYMYMYMYIIINILTCNVII